MAFDGSTYKEGLPYMPPRTKTSKIPRWFLGLLAVGSATTAASVGYNLALVMRER